MLNTSKTFMKVNPNVSGLRPCRMSAQCAVLVSRGDKSWTTLLRDISATGLLIKRPSQFHGQRGDSFVIDMIFSEDLDLHLEASVARLTDDSVGFAFARIPPEKESALWNLLGGYADSLELWS
jgi:hypothetical protein